MKPMKTIKLLTLALTALLAVTVHARTLDEIKKGGKIIIATEGAYAPFNFFQGTKLTGFEVELTELVIKKMGVEIEWKALGFDALLTGLRQDRWDLVIASHGITEERAKAVTFTEPHYCSGGLIVAKSGANIKSAADLAGKTVSVQTGTTYLDNVKKVAGVKDIKNFPNDLDARSALASGRVDVWVTDRYVAIEALRKNPGMGLKAGDLLFTEQIAAAVAKGNSGLAQAWNTALATVMKDGSYEALQAKYFTENLRCK